MAPVAAASARGGADARKGGPERLGGGGGSKEKYDFGRSSQRTTGHQLCSLLQNSGVKSETLANLEKLKNMSPHASALSELFLKLVDGQAKYV